MGKSTYWSYQWQGWDYLTIPLEMLSHIAMGVFIGYTLWGHH